MEYFPNAKALVYGELNFVSTVNGLTEIKVSYDMDALLDEVSNEVFALFIGEPRPTAALEVVRQAQMV
ncbi:hypothetical protein [Vampirovibrio chlorellavorus]|uniref:hypothetical protein n=1 Tax=Vampirovibrio chlorellavorus TaxID=758823 RepID=UPI0026EFF645|nr:hypothetical protein [Vampirovibrio chlorellavorus]